MLSANGVADFEKEIFENIGTKKAEELTTIMNTQREYFIKNVLSVLGSLLINDQKSLASDLYKDVLNQCGDNFNKLYGTDYEKVISSEKFKSLFFSAIVIKKFYDESREFIYSKHSLFNYVGVKSTYNFFIPLKSIIMKLNVLKLLGEGKSSYISKGYNSFIYKGDFKTDFKVFAENLLS